TLDLPFKIPAESPKSEEPPKTEEPPKSEASKARQQTTADPQTRRFNYSWSTTNESIWKS
ncbi:MAG: hypothetical protein ACI8ZW_000886, partial [Yoonia sp.]